jgi:ABC-2 type transport system ATP-binding protein
VKGYSLGMRQRLGLAVALLGDPELLILDEPANGLDPEGVRWLRDFLRGLASEGRTVLISSHVLAEVAQTVDRVLIVSHGRLLLSSSLSEFRAALASPPSVSSRMSPLLSATV